MRIISSIGDPESPTTWSGTPSALVAALRKEFAGLTCHEVTASPAAKRIGQVSNLLAGCGMRQPSRVGSFHRALQRAATGVVEELGAGPFLHFGSGHLPILGEQLQSALHFGFTDYSISLLNENARFRDMTTRRYRQRAMVEEREMLRQLHGLFVTSDYVRDAFVRHHGLDPSRVVTVGSGLGRIKPADPVERDFSRAHLLFVAKFNFLNKGGRLLLDAFEIVRRERPETRLIIVGNHDDPDAKQDLGRMLGMPGITFKNFDTPDYQDLVRTAALYTGPAPDEPWGIIYLEALAAGTPVLMLDRNAARQFTDGGRNGFLVKDSTPEAVAEAILDALSDPARLAAMGLAGRRHVLETFSWERAARNIADHVRGAQPVASSGA